MSGQKNVAIDGLQPIVQLTSEHQPSGWRIVPAAVVAIVGGAILISLAEPAVRDHLDRTAANLVARTATQSGAIRLASLEAANLIAPGNRAAASATALDQAKDGRPADALETLTRVRDQSGSEAAYQMAVIAANLEAGRPEAALTAADAVTAMAAPGDEALVMAAAAYGVESKLEQATALAPRLTSSEARSRVLRAGAGKLTLASTLQATGLYISSSSILKNLPVSVTRNTMLAQAYEQREQTNDLKLASALYREAISLDVTNREVRRGLVRTLGRLGQSDAAATQQRMLDRLDQQKP